VGVGVGERGVGRGGGGGGGVLTEFGVNKYIMTKYKKSMGSTVRSS